MPKKLKIILDRTRAGYVARYRSSGHEGTFMWPGGARESDSEYTTSALLGKTARVVSDVRPSQLIVVVHRRFLGLPEDKDDNLRSVERTYAETATQQGIGSVRIRQKTNLMHLIRDCRYNAGL